MKLSKNIYRDVIYATILVNLFVLATPLFTMSVYDRVIPNNATETLWVFSTGVLIVYLLDMFLKFTRAMLLESAGKKSDVIMSSIIFEKVLDLRMSSHPKSVGSFASNLKDFDSIRSFLTNATLTALVDFPFSRAQCIDCSHQHSGFCSVCLHVDEVVWNNLQHHVAIGSGIGRG